VAAFRERLGRVGLDARSLGGRRVAAIGPETAEALRRGGIEPDLVPAEYRAEGLVNALGTRLDRGDAVLLVRAAEARDVLPRELEARGVRVTVAPAYRTALAGDGAADVLGLLESRRIDAVTFTSSSTVRGFVALLAPSDARRLLDGVVVAAIGPITAETAAEHGLRVSVMPHEYMVPALADAIAGHFETSPPAALRG
jgi:uroporphyrinogen III methyltransferase/synthase